ncbi:hypothetical protein Tco_0042235 [Tanacetum coccineum]
MEAQQEEQAQELYNRVAELQAHVMDVSGRLEGEFYPAYLTALAGRRWLLTHGMELAMVKCLKSPEYQGILGHALGRAVDYGMQEGLVAGHEHGIAGTPLSAIVAYDPETAKNDYFDAVRVLVDVFRRVGISVKKEAPVNFLTGPSKGRSTLRPADILIFGWVGGKHACVDLTGVSPFVGLGSGCFIVGQAALKAASFKVKKHEKACLENQHVFIPFAFDTFGFFASEDVELLKRVQRVMHSNVMTPRSLDVVFKRISFAIQRGVAAQLVARLPSTSM